MASAALASSVPQAVKNVFATTARRTGNTATGVVVSAGLAEKTAKVRIGGEIWNNKVKKVPRQLFSLRAGTGNSYLPVKKKKKKEKVQTVV